MSNTAATGRSHQMKVVLLGEGCVGKTSLVLRYCENRFNEKHVSTLQVHVTSSFTDVTDFVPEQTDRIEFEASWLFSILFITRMCTGVVLD